MSASPPTSVRAQRCVEVTASPTGSPAGKDRLPTIQVSFSNPRTSGPSTDAGSPGPPSAASLLEMPLLHVLIVYIDEAHTHADDGGHRKSRAGSPYQGSPPRSVPHDQGKSSGGGGGNRSYWSLLTSTKTALPAGENESEPPWIQSVRGWEKRLRETYEAASRAHFQFSEEQGSDGLCRDVDGFYHTLYVLLQPSLVALQRETREALQPSSSSSSIGRTGFAPCVKLNPLVASQQFHSCAAVLQQVADSFPSTRPSPAIVMYEDESLASHVREALQAALASRETTLRRWWSTYAGQRPRLVHSSGGPCIQEGKYSSPIRPSFLSPTFGEEDRFTVPSAEVSLGNLSNTPSTGPAHPAQPPAAGTSGNAKSSSSTTKIMGSPRAVRVHQKQAPPGNTALAAVLSISDPHPHSTPSAALQPLPPLLWSLKRCWLYGFTLVQHCLVSHQLEEAIRVLDSMYKAYYNRSEEYVLLPSESFPAHSVPPLIRWSRCAQLLDPRTYLAPYPAGSFRDISSHFSLSASQADTLPIALSCAFHPGSDLLPGLLFVYSSLLFCQSMEYRQKVERRSIIIRQTKQSIFSFTALLKEVFEEQPQEEAAGEELIPLPLQQQLFLLQLYGSAAFVLCSVGGVAAVPTTESLHASSKMRPEDALPRVSRRFSYAVIDAALAEDEGVEYRVWGAQEEADGLGLAEALGELMLEARRAIPTMLSPPQSRERRLLDQLHSQDQQEEGTLYGSLRGLLLDDTPTTFSLRPPGSLTSPTTLWSSLTLFSAEALGVAGCRRIAFNLFLRLSLLYLCVGNSSELQSSPNASPPSVSGARRAMWVAIRWLLPLWTAITAEASLPSSLHHALELAFRTMYVEAVERVLLELAEEAGKREKDPWKRLTPEVIVKAFAPPHGSPCELMEDSFQAYYQLYRLSLMWLIQQDEVKKVTEESETMVLQPASCRDWALSHLVCEPGSIVRQITCRSAAELLRRLLLVDAAWMKSLESSENEEKESQVARVSFIDALVAQHSGDAPTAPPIPVELAETTQLHIAPLEALLSSSLRLTAHAGELPRENEETTLAGSEASTAELPQFAPPSPMWVTIDVPLVPALLSLLRQCGTEEEANAARWWELTVELSNEWVPLEGPAATLPTQPAGIFPSSNTPYVFVLHHHHGRTPTNTLSSPCAVVEMVEHLRVSFHLSSACSQHHRAMEGAYHLRYVRLAIGETTTAVHSIWHHVVRPSSPLAQSTLFVIKPLDAAITLQIGRFIDMRVKGHHEEDATARKKQPTIEWSLTVDLGALPCPSPPVSPPPVLTDPNTRIYGTAQPPLLGPLHGSTPPTSSRMVPTEAPPCLSTATLEGREWRGILAAAAGTRTFDLNAGFLALGGEAVESPSIALGRCILALQNAAKQSLRYGGRSIQLYRETGEGLSVLASSLLPWQKTEGSESDYYLVAHAPSLSSRPSHRTPLYSFTVIPAISSSSRAIALPGTLDTQRENSLTAAPLLPFVPLTPPPPGTRERFYAIPSCLVGGIEETRHRNDDSGFIPREISVRTSQDPDGPPPRRTFSLPMDMFWLCGSPESSFSKRRSRGKRDVSRWRIRVLQHHLPAGAASPVAPAASIDRGGELRWYPSSSGEEACASSGESIELPSWPRLRLRFKVEYTPPIAVLAVSMEPLNVPTALWVGEESLHHPSTSKTYRLIATLQNIANWGDEKKEENDEENEDWLRQNAINLRGLIPHIFQRTAPVKSAAAGASPPLASSLELSSSLILTRVGKTLDGMYRTPWYPGETRQVFWEVERKEGDISSASAVVQMQCWYDMWDGSEEGKRSVLEVAHEDFVFSSKPRKAVESIRYRNEGEALQELYENCVSVISPAFPLSIPSLGAKGN